MSALDAAQRAPFVVRSAEGPRAPVVFDSPHSGFEWPADFRPTASRDAIRTTWDAHVDALWSGAPSAGAALLSASFPRAYIDVNRAETDLDPALLADAWPGVLSPTDYSRRGMGLIRRDALPGVPMYVTPLAASEVRGRIERCYRPYRQTLRTLLESCHAADGVAWHVNCHSMKSRGNAMNVDSGALRPDIVVSDRRGTSAEPAITARAVGWFTLRGYRAQANDPYQGGDLVRSFGDPLGGRQSMQIELNRALYMDELTTERHAGFAALQDDLSAFVAVLVGWAREAAVAGRPR